MRANPEDYSLVWTSGSTAALRLVAETLTPHTFAYLTESHTSLVGMRQLAQNSKALTREQVEESAFPCTCNEGKQNLFAFPAMSNFCGKKFPIREWSDAPECRKCWPVFLDTAGMASTSQLKIDHWKPDFACISFYKIFGYFFSQF